jgi:hypothetical protein
MTSMFATVFLFCFAIGATTAAVCYFLRRPTSRLILLVFAVYGSASGLASDFAGSNKGLLHLGLELVGFAGCVSAIVLIAVVLKRVTGRWHLKSGFDVSGRRCG